MTKKSPEQQSPESIEGTLAHEVAERRIQGRAETISPFEVPGMAAVDTGASGVAIEVRDYDGADTYLVREAGNYRTADRLDLATRLQLDPTYDPADLVGRVFLVEA